MIESSRATVVISWLRDSIHLVAYGPNLAFPAWGST